MNDEKMRKLMIRMKKLSFRMGILLACCLLACLDGCQDDTVAGDIQEVEKDMSFTLRVPGTDVAPLSRAMDAADENHLAAGDVYILLFRENTSGKYEYAYRLVPRSFVEETDPLGATYTIGILHGFSQSDWSVNFRAMIVAGVTGSDMDEFEKHIDEVNRAENPIEAARARLMFTQAGNWPVTRKLPMWGESPLSFKLDAENLGTITLLRAVARVDVGVNFEKNGDNYPLSSMVSQGLPAPGNTFRLSRVYLYNVPQSGSVGSPDANIGPGGQVTAPSVDGISVEPAAPSPRCSYTAIDLVGTDGKKSLTRTLYVPEAGNKTDDNMKAVCLVVGGYFNTDQDETYYRVDIYDRTPVGGAVPKPSADNRMSLLRNHVVVVNITGIRGRGFGTAEEALRSDPTFLDFEVSAWDQSVDIGDITTDGTYFMSLTPPGLSYYTDGAPREATLETDYRGELGEGWTMTPDQAAKDWVYFLTPDSTVVRWGNSGWPTSGVPGVKKTFRIGMLPFVSTGSETSPRTATLTFTAGRMTRKLTLQQTNAENLNIELEPREMKFGKSVTESRELHIGIVATQKRELVAEWMSADGHTSYRWDIMNPAGECPDSRFDKNTFFTPVPGKPGYYTLQLAENTSGSVRYIIMDITARYMNGESRTATLGLLQSAEDVSWSVTDDMGDVMREITIPANSTSQTLNITTSLNWHFSSDPVATEVKWITNLANFVNQNFNGSQNISLALKPNTGVEVRRVELQAFSPVEGFDEASSRVVLVQLGQAPFFNIVSTSSISIEKESDFDWVLDYKDRPLVDFVYSEIEAGSNWKWAWDRSEPGFEERYAMVLSYFNSSIPENTLTDKDITSGGSLWNTAMSFVSVDLGTWSNTEVLGHDNNVLKTIPTAGEHSIRMLFTPSYPGISDEDAKLYTRRLTLKRAVPAYTFIAAWPYAAGTNLDRYAEDISTDDGTGKPSEGRFVVRTNAPGRLDIVENGVVSVGTDVVPATGYEEFSLRLPSGHPLEPMQGIESYQKPLVTFQLRYTGKRKQSADGNIMEQQQWSRTYTSGTKIVEPKRNLKSGQRMVSNGAQNLVFDFSDSKYLLLEGKYTVYITDSDGGIIDTERTEEFTLDDRKGETQLKVALPANTLVNQYKRVTLSVKRWTAPGVAKWEELDTHVYQDAIPLENGYIVKYTHGLLLDGVNKTFEDVNPKSSRSCVSTDATLKVAWYEVSPITSLWAGKFSDVVKDVKEANAKFLTSGVKIAEDPKGQFKATHTLTLSLFLEATINGKLVIYSCNKRVTKITTPAAVMIPLSEWRNKSDEKNQAPLIITYGPINNSSSTAEFMRSYGVTVKTVFDGLIYIGGGGGIYGTYLPLADFTDNQGKKIPGGITLKHDESIIKDSSRDEWTGVTWTAISVNTARARKPIQDGTINGMELQGE